jgi:succinate dehydrogenase / fumarate reductase cytochrome b subunit
MIYLGKKRARPTRYGKYASAGKPSRQTLSSRSMILTGVILFVFIVFHVWTFKYGPGMSEGYVVNLNGEEVRDIRRLLVEKFQSPVLAFGYTAIMLLLFLHLRHGCALR